MTEPAGTEAAEGPPAAAPAPERWLAACRAAVEAQREIFASHRGIAARTEYDGVGEGGDHTLVIDRLCEDAVFAELDSLHAEGAEFRAVAEERGEVSFGDGDSRLRVVIDPIDGSVNARRTIPCHSLSFAVAEGDSMAEVGFGYVYEFGAEEEFVAIRGEGATLNGERIQAPEGDGLELVALEAAKPERTVAVAQALAGKAHRLRSPGSIAASLCYVASGRYDAMLSTRPTRSVDAAAGQLILREAGGAVGFGGGGLDQAPLALAARYPVAGARTEGDLETVLGAQAAIP